MAKERKINGEDSKPIHFYVKRLVLHYDDILDQDDVNDILLFPNLQYIDGLCDGITSAREYKPVYLHLHQPTDFTYFPQIEEWKTRFNTINKGNLKSLHIYISNDFDDTDLIQQEEQMQVQQQQQQQLENIHVESIGRYLNIPDASIKMLRLPTSSLTNLITLKIDFTCYEFRSKTRPPKYIIDQHTFENIHQSCPSLESLTVEQFFMDISDEYYDNDKNNIVPARRLKSMNIIGRLCSPHCCSYLSIKYPHLESLYIYLCYYSLSEEMTKIYQNAVLNMLLQLPMLKKLNYEKNPYNNIWPYYEFFKWLNREAKQLTHLTYTHPLTINKSRELANISDDIDLLSMQQQFNFLNHLTSLSLGIDNVTDLAFTFLSENKNTTIISAILEELNIEYSFGRNTMHVYIYDWLDMFPNMLLFRVWDGKHIIDNSDLINDYVNIKSKEGDTFYKLHQLIRERKQHIYGHLNKVKDKNNNDNYNNESLKLHYISCSPISKFQISNAITKLVIQETTTDQERIMEKNIPKDDPQQFILKLNCKFIDAFTYRIHI
ncbi:unnamed protein product [Cunninghamella blakesleeana]